MTTKNAGAPLGRRSAAHASKRPAEDPECRLGKLVVPRPGKNPRDQREQRRPGVAEEPGPVSATGRLATSTVNALFACCTGARKSENLCPAQRR